MAAGADRGPDGLPRDLPPVDASFDFDGFVDARLAAAREAEAAGDVAGLARELAELARVDPLQPALPKLRAAQTQLAAAAQARAQAESLAASGDDMEAYRLLIAVPQTAPDAAAAHARAAQLKARAVADAVKRADHAVVHAPLQAQSSYRFALALDPDHHDALRGIGLAEARLRREAKDYSPYLPGSGPPPTPAAVAAARAAALGAHFKRDAQDQALAARYLKAGPGAARKLAKTTLRRARGRSAKAQAKARLARLKRLAAAAAKVQRQLRQSPEQAWTALEQLREQERAWLPAGLRSYTELSLSVALAQQLAKLGAAARAAGEPEAAFSRWQSALKLNPINATAREGVRSLITEAETKLQTLRERPGSGGCEVYRQLTRVTPAGSEVHQTARAAALRCR